MPGKPGLKGRRRAPDPPLELAAANTGHPLTPSGIVPAAAKLSGAKEISIRTRIAPLAQAGESVRIEHEGRGYRYGLPAR